jgi:RNA polymerase sigma-70 factor, ECF subfamily
MNPETDAIVARVLAGDVDAYGEIVDRHQRDVWSIAAAALRNREATADIVQQIFVDAYVHLRRFQQGGDFGTWLRGIARNEVREHLRKRSRETKLLQAYASHVEVRLADPASADRFESAMADAQRRCRKELPEPSLRALALRYDENLSHQEIASRLGRSAEAVKQLLYRVHVALRDCIQRRLVQA